MEYSHRLHPSHPQYTLILVGPLHSRACRHTRGILRQVSLAPLNPVGSPSPPCPPPLLVYMPTSQGAPRSRPCSLLSRPSGVLPQQHAQELSQGLIQLFHPPGVSPLSETCSSQARSTSPCLMASPKTTKARYNFKGKKGPGSHWTHPQRSQCFTKEPLFGWHGAPAAIATLVPGASSYERQSPEVYCAVQESELAVSSMASKKCHFNPLWVEDPLFSAWVKEDPKDDTKAYCKLCKKRFDIANMGVSALRSHMKSNLHNRISQSRQNPSAIRNFFGKKQDEKADDAAANVTSSAPVASTSTAP
ncbi:uncharacterized protein LOC143031022 isoform X3 [Oratosquilla oratoria]|uniref:uncharacterized protein LOC143031022 isoform X3 n=1 Tax=Oratosquilla oratoria TaxID=337810 RepID=UPI003F76347A